MILSTQNIFSQGEPFAFSELNHRPANPNKYRLAHPFEIIYGPDDHLYITEKVGRVLRVDPITGLRRILLDHRSVTYLSSHSSTSISQDGMMGMALHPPSEAAPARIIFMSLIHTAAGNVRISRFNYTGGASPVLNNETVLY